MDKGHHTRTPVDGRIKRQTSHLSVMSPKREGMPRRMAKVKPGPALPPQDPGGRCRETCERGLAGNGA